MPFVENSAGNGGFSGDYLGITGGKVAGVLESQSIAQRLIIC